jgi:hypothetical protein
LLDPPEVRYLDRERVPGGFLSLRRASVLPWWLGTALAVSTQILIAPTASAAEGPARISAGHKGMVGLGLVGAELGLTIPALCGLDDVWALVVFPVIGAAGGAIGGHYALDRPNHRVAAVAMLSVGLALVVPAILITRVALSFDPHEEGVEVVGSARARRALAAARAGPGLLRFGGGQLFVAVPSVDVLPAGPTFSPADPFAMRLRTEVHVALLSGAF